MDLLIRANRFLGKYYPFLTVGCVLMGLLFSDTLSVLSRVTMPLFAFITFANSLGGGYRDLFRVARHPRPVITVLLLLHVVMPLVAMALGNLLFPQAPLFTTGLILEYAIPTAVASLMWAGMSGGSTTLCLSILLMDTVLSPVVVPLTLRLLAGSVVEMDAAGMMGDLLVMVGIPALAAMALYDGTRGRVAKTVKPALEPFAKLSLLAVIIANATSCTPFLRDLNKTLLLVILAAIVLCFFGYFLGFYTGLLQKEAFPTVMSMAINTGMRNISAGAVLAAQYFPPEVLFPVAFSPLFLQVSAATIVRILLRTRQGRAWQASQQTNP